MTCRGSKDQIPEGRPFLPRRALIPNAALALVSAYSAFYVVLEPVAGISWALTVGLPMWLSSTAWAAAVGGQGVPT